VSKRAGQKQAARLVREQLARERRHRRTMWTSIAAALALVVAGIVGYAVFAAQRPAGDFRVPAGATADRTGVTVGDGPVTVEVYLDYLCPACRAFEADAGDTIERYLEQERISLVYHPVAILDRASTNRYSSRSAAGAGCASDAGLLSEYTEALYARQPAEGGPGHTDDALVEIAAGVGLPAEAFGQCLRDEVYEDWVKHVTEEMARRGVRGTPTVFVNGTQLPNPTGQTLAAAIDAVGS
jgi:protein-disulfide isomerase